MNSMSTSVIFGHRFWVRTRSFLWGGGGGVGFGGVKFNFNFDFAFKKSPSPVNGNCLINKSSHQNFPTVSCLPAPVPPICRTRALESGNWSKTILHLMIPNATTHAHSLLVLWCIVVVSIPTTKIVSELSICPSHPLPPPPPSCRLSISCLI
jgi:hypothetical protein